MQALTFVTLSLLGELGEVDRIFAGLRHLRHEKQSQRRVQTRSMISRSRDSRLMLDMRRGRLAITWRKTRMSDVRGSGSKPRGSVRGFIWSWWWSGRESDGRRSRCCESIKTGPLGRGLESRQALGRVPNWGAGFRVKGFPRLSPPALSPLRSPNVRTAANNADLHTIVLARLSSGCSSCPLSTSIHRDRLARCGPATKKQTQQTNRQLAQNGKRPLAGGASRSSSPI